MSCIRRITVPLIAAVAVAVCCGVGSSRSGVDGDAATSRDDARGTIATAFPTAQAGFAAQPAQGR